MAADARGRSTCPNGKAHGRTIAYGRREPSRSTRLDRIAPCTPRRRGYPCIHLALPGRVPQPLRRSCDRYLMHRYVVTLPPSPRFTGGRKMEAEEVAQGAGIGFSRDGLAHGAAAASKTASCSAHRRRRSLRGCADPRRAVAQPLKADERRGVSGLAGQLRLCGRARHWKRDCDQPGAPTSPHRLFGPFRTVSIPVVGATA